MNSKVIIFLIANITVALARTTKTSTSSANSFTTNLKNSMKTLGGVNCLVESALEVENAANGFADDIKACNVKQNEAISTILDDCNLLKALSKRVVEANDNVCENDEYNEKSDAKKTASSRCAQEVKTKMTYLYNFLQYSLKDVKQNTGNSCSDNAANDLLINLKYFPDAIESCADTYKKK